LTVSIADKNLTPLDQAVARGLVEKHPLGGENYFLAAEKIFSADVALQLNDSSVVFQYASVLSLLNGLYGGLISSTFHGCESYEIQAIHSNSSRNHKHTISIQKSEDKYAVSVGYSGATGGLMIDGKSVLGGQRSIGTVSAMQLNAVVARYFDDLVTRIVEILEGIDGIGEHFRNLPFFVACEGRWGPDADFE
jgi:hypothetical protein